MDAHTDGRTDGWTDDGLKVITTAHPEQSSGKLIMCTQIFYCINKAHFFENFIVK